MLQIPAEYDRDMLAKLRDIPCQLHALLLDVSATTRKHWWMTHKRLELRWRRTIHQKTAAVHGTLCMIPPCNTNQ
jgi:hypothetical protein